MSSEATLLALENDIIDNPSFILKVRPESDYAEYVIKDGVLYDEGIARETKMVLEKLNPGRKYYLLVSSEGFFRVTRKARKLGATQKFSSHLAAVAYFTNNTSLALLGELYNKINKPAVPTKVFSSRESAEEWLQEMRLKTAVA